MSIRYLCGTRYGILYLQSTEIGNVCVRTRCKIKEGIGRILIKSINDPTATKKTVRLSLYYPEIWDAYQSLVFETVVNGPHQEPEGPQILESMKEKKKKLDDELPRPKTTLSVPVLMVKALAVFRTSKYFPRNRIRGYSELRIRVREDD
jgi:hypothetical protein